MNINNNPIHTHWAKKTVFRISIISVIGALLVLSVLFYRKIYSPNLLGVNQNFEADF